MAVLKVSSHSSAKTTPFISPPHSTEVWRRKSLPRALQRGESTLLRMFPYIRARSAGIKGSHSCPPELPSRSPKPAGEIPPGNEGQTVGTRGKGNSVQLVPKTYGHGRSSPRMEKDTCRCSHHPGPGTCLHFYKVWRSTHSCLGEREEELRRQSQNQSQRGDSSFSAARRGGGKP